MAVSDAGQAHVTMPGSALLACTASKMVTTVK